MAAINLDIINTLTFINTTFKDIFLNKRHVNCLNFRDQLSIDKRNLNKQTKSLYINQQTNENNFSWIYLNLIECYVSKDNT